MQELKLQLPTSSGYIDLITRYPASHLKSLFVTVKEIDMFDWMEQVGWKNASRLAKHMQLIPNVEIHFRPNDDYELPETRQESRMTQFFKCSMS